MKTASLVAALACTLAACAAGPDFRPPAAPAAERYTMEPLPDVALTTGLPAADLPQWWQAFQSPKLDETVRAALAGNRSLQAAQASLARARALDAAGRSARLPQATLEAGNGRSQYGAAFLGPLELAPFTYYSVGANVSYLLDFSGGVRRSIEARHALAEAQGHELEAAHLALTGNVVLQALTIASVRAQLRAAEAVIEDDRRNVALVREALQEGSVARVDLLGAESQLAQDLTLLPPLRQELSVAQHALAVLEGQPPGNRGPRELDLEDFQPPATLPLSLPSELAHRRPDIRADEARLHAAMAEVGIATANLYPQIRLTGSLSQQSLQAGELFERGSTAWSLVGNLTAPLFDAGKLRAERRAAEAAARAAAARYEQTVLTAFGQVADVLTALQHDAEQSAAQQRALEAAESSLALTRASYEAGNVGVLQILDAERLLQRARIGVARARAQRLQDAAELIVALGGSSPLGAEDAAGALAEPDAPGGAQTGLATIRKNTTTSETKATTPSATQRRR